MLDGGDQRRQRRRGRSKGLGLLSFSIMQPLERMAELISAYREAQTNPTPITRITTNKVAAYTLVHCADTMARPRRTASGSR